MHGAEGKAGMIEQQTACTSQPRLYRRMEFLKAPGMAKLCSKRWGGQVSGKCQQYRQPKGSTEEVGQNGARGKCGKVRTVKGGL